jgi:opacity protein-like surface antigen
MNKLKFLFVVSTIFFANASYAQPSKFQGAFGQLGIGYESVSQTQLSASGAVNFTPVPVNTSANNANSMTGTFALGWYQNIAKGFLMGVGAEYSPFAGSAANKTATVQAGPMIISNNYRWQKKESYNIFLSPAVTVGTDGLAYAKVGFTGAKATDFTTRTDNLTGYSLGVGYKQLFADGWYGFIEFNYANYGKATMTVTDPPGGPRFDGTATNGLATYNGLVGIGYRF